MRYRNLIYLPCLSFMLLALLSRASLAADQPRTLSPIDVARLSAVTSVYPSPDGTQVAFVRSVPRLAPDPPGTDYSHLLIVSSHGGEPRLLRGGTINVHGISWSPDGGLLCFLDKRGDDKQTQLYGLPMNGGEPVRIFTAPQGVLQYAWRPDGRAVAFTATDPAGDLEQEQQQQGFAPIVVDEQWDSASLFLWEGGESIRRLTSREHVHSMVWSPDGKRLAAALSPRALIDDTYMFQRLHRIDPAGPLVEPLVDNPGKLGDYVFSPDGTQLAYISAADRRDPHAGMLFSVDLMTRQVTSLTDQFEGMVHTVLWQHPTQLTACISRGVNTEIAALNLTDKTWNTLSSAGPAFTNLGACGAADAKTWVVAGSTATHPSEVYRFDGHWTRLTVSNPDLPQYQLGKQTVQRITARDGLEFEGLLLEPVNYQPEQRYPLVIVAHGGPESHFVNGWNTSYSRWGQILAGQGYFVWMPNYRASTGRGVAFAKADHGDPMGAEFNDHLDAIAEFARRGLIDPKRVGIGGGSYGGYTAAWAATRHSQHFAAAVAFVPVVDLRTKWYCSDIPFEYYYVHYEEKWPHEQTEFLAAQSPNLRRTMPDPLAVAGRHRRRAGSPQPAPDALPSCQVRHQNSLPTCAIRRRRARQSSQCESL